MKHLFENRKVYVPARLAEAIRNEGFDHFEVVDSSEIFKYLNDILFKKD